MVEIEDGGKKNVLRLIELKDKSVTKDEKRNSLPYSHGHGRP